MKPNRDYFANTDQHKTLLHAFVALEGTSDIGVTCTNVRGDDSAFSWSSLVERARKRATWLQENANINPYQTIGLALPNDTSFIECLFACWMLGGIPVPLARPGLFGPQTLERTRHIIKDAGLKHILYVEEDLKHFTALDEAVELILPAPTDDCEPFLFSSERFPCSPSEPGLIQYTSGSTSRPRGVVLTHDNLAQNCHHITVEHTFGPRESFTSWLPFYHDMGLIAELLTTVYQGLPFFLMEPMAFLQDPFSWLSVISRHQCTMTHVPNFALAHCVKRATDEQLSKLDLRCLRGLFLGAEPIDHRIVKAFIQRFKSAGLDPQAVSSAYGLAEFTVGATRGAPMQGLHFDTVDREQLAQGKATPADSNSKETKSIASVGKVIYGHQIMVANTQGQALQNREVGEIWLSGPSIMKGYWENNAATAEVLIERDGQTWLKTGDLGYLVGEALYICGRLKEVLIIRGKNYHPEDIERTAEQVEGIRPGQTVAFSIPGEASEQIVLVCETTEPESSYQALAQQLKSLINTQLGLKLQHVELQPPRTIPKTTSGKRQRRLVRRFWMKMRGLT